MRRAPFLPAGGPLCKQKAQAVFSLRLERKTDGVITSAENGRN
jgi:hypothetical protein